MPPKNNKGKDARFATLQTDPRFRKTKAKQLKVEVDDRFKAVLDEGGVFAKEASGSKAKTDKYGRTVSKHHDRDQLQKFYRLGESSTSKPDDGDSKPDFVDYARGEGVLESSGDEDSSEDEEIERSDEEDEDEDEIVELGGKKKKAKKHHGGMSDDSELEIDLSEGDDDDDNAFEEETDPAALARLQAQADSFKEADAEAESSAPTTTEHTNRLAIVNLDWDHVHAVDIFKIFTSVLEQAGRKGKELVNVKVYPSEFGKKRMEREEREGPPREVFVKAGEEMEDDSEGEREEIHFEDEQELEEDGEEEDGDLEMEDEEPVVEEDEGEEIDMDRLRKYQLERLRYYYAVATFASPSAAAFIHTECDNTEFERTANMFDIRFVPDEMTFDDEARDEATEDPSLYKGLDFVTDALRHSSVKLTWDADAPSRTKVTRRKLSRKEIDEQDFSAFIGSGSESEDDDNSRSARLRNLLMGNLGGGASRRKDGVADGFGGGGSDSEMSDDENAFGRADDSGAMEITFAPGLSEKRGNEVMEEASEENTLDAYKRKMREKRKARKEERDAKFAGEAAEKEAGKSNRKDDGKGKKAAASPAGGDDFFGEESDDSGDVPPPSTNAKASKSKSSSSKPAPSTSAITTSTSSTDPSAKEAAFLDLLTLPTPGAIGKVDDSKHFSMTDIMKDEKAAGHKKRKRAPHSKKKGGEKDVELGDREFEIDVSDPRFSKKLNEDHRFAIDPSNPHFKKTKSMSKLLSERSRLREEQGREGPIEKSSSSNGKKNASGDVDLDELVRNVKRKVAPSTSAGGGSGKGGGKKGRK